MAEENKLQKGSLGLWYVVFFCGCRRFTLNWRCGRLTCGLYGGQWCRGGRDIHCCRCIAAYL